MDASLFVNHIDPAFVAGLFMGLGTAGLAYLLVKYGKRMMESEETENHYDEVEKIFKNKAI